MSVPFLLPEILYSLYQDMLAFVSDLVGIQQTMETLESMTTVT